MYERVALYFILGRAARKTFPLVAWEAGQLPSTCSLQGNSWVEQERQCALASKASLGKAITNTSLGKELARISRI